MATKKPATPKKKKSAKSAPPITDTEVPANGAAEGPHVYGQIPPEILNAVSSMRDRSNNLTMELGRIEMRKAAIIEQLRHMENQSQNMLREEAKRMNIPDGANWQMTPDGMALATPGG